MPGSFPSDDGHGSPTDVEAADVDVADLVSQVSRRMRRRTRSALAPLGVTWAQVRALRAMRAGDDGTGGDGGGDGHGDGHGDAVRMSVLADRLGVVRRSATSVVDELVDKGLAARRDDPADRRAVVVAPTARGRRLLARVDHVRSDSAADLVRDLDPDEVETLVGLLRRLRPDDQGATG